MLKNRGFLSYFLTFQIKLNIRGRYQYFWDTFSHICYTKSSLNSRWDERIWPHQNLITTQVTLRVRVEPTWGKCSAILQWSWLPGPDYSYVVATMSSLDMISCMLYRLSSDRFVILFVLCLSLPTRASFSSSVTEQISNWRLMKSVAWGLSLW